jgi:hypothetical protein
MLRRLLIGGVAGAIIAIALVAVLEQISESGQAEARRALLARNAQLTVQAMAPGSALACLDAEPGETVVNACEMALFESPQAVAGATAYMRARVAILREAVAQLERGDGEALNDLAAVRRGVARDRFGVAAYVLARDYGCTAAQCSALSIVSDPATLKADLDAKPFETLIARHQVTWARPPAEPGTPLAAASPQISGAQASVQPPSPAFARAGTAPPAGTLHPIDSRWKLPSSDSIPAVSIMTAEPKASKTEAATPPAAPQAPHEQATHEHATPLPPKRPQPEAAPAPQAR